MGRQTLVSILCLVAISYISFIQGSNLGVTTSPQLVFEESFETDTGWMMFEEIVDKNCYGTGIGQVVTSTDVSYDGSYSLLVHANQALSTKSNHVIAYKKYSNTGETGIWGYQIHTYISPTTVNTGQTGPEFSMQNTRQTTPITFTTSTAGIQYIANPTPPEASSWKVWREEITPGIASWQTFMTKPITSGVWYTLTLEANYINNRYNFFSIQGDGISQTVDLSPYRIAAENKFTEETFVVTLESENLWNNCDMAGIYEYQVYYDQVALTQQLANVFLPIIFK